jgi:tetratricopeptide (TPR) repeat protein
VVTPSLVEAAVQRHWLFDENQIAVMESNAGRLRTVYVLREGESMPGFAGGAIPIDMRGDPGDFSVLARELEYDGLRLSPEEQHELLALIGRVEALLESERYADALELLRGGQKFAQADEHKELRAYGLRGVNALEEAADTVYDILENGRPAHETLIGLGLLLGELGDPQTSLRVFLHAHSMAPALPEIGHFSIADALADMGSLQGATNHARQWLTLLADPSVADRELVAELEGRARERAAPTEPADRTTIGCRGCPAEYEMSSEADRLCGRCASVYPAVANACSYCGHTGFIPVAMVRAVEGAVACPTCRTDLVTNLLEVRK